MGIGGRDANRTNDYGLWQINWPTHAGVAGVTDPTQLFVPATNAAAAFIISDQGRNWKPWVTYNTGAEVPFLPAAAAAAAAIGG